MLLKCNYYIIFVVRETPRDNRLLNIIMPVLKLNHRRRTFPYYYKLL